MTKFVNWLEKQYPFADNIKPVTALGRLLWRENKLGLLSAAWLLSRFVARHPQASLGSTSKLPDIPRLMREHLQVDDAFGERFTNLYRHLFNSEATLQRVESALKDDQGVEDFLKTMIVKTSPNEWLSVLDVGESRALSIGDGTRSLAIISSGMGNEKMLLRNKAKELFEQGAEVVVFGHTHQPDKLILDGRTYVNPGSWTRYVEIEHQSHLALADLADESDYPYRLNFVRIEEPPIGLLNATMYCFEKQDGRRFEGAIADEHTVAYNS